MSQNQLSDGKWVSIESTPAYWKYSGLRQKNMLVQVARIKERISDQSIQGDINSDLAQSTLVSSSATTWKDWGSGQWRQNDHFVATKSGSAYVEFDKWSTYDEEQNSPSVGDVFNGWKRTSNITAFDRFGHPIEERSINGTYTSSLYGFSDALPIAIVSNSPYGTHTDGQPRGFSYCGFESTSGTAFDGGWSHTEEQAIDEAFTGAASAKISTTGGGSEFGPTLDLGIDDGLVNNTTYIVSCWVKTSSPNFYLTAKKNNGNPSVTKTTADAIALVGDWKLIQFEYAIDGWNSSDYLRVFPGNNNDMAAYVDDIRVYPKDASMTTFTYDPLTWKLTSVTDANNISTFYEYDGAGRLIKVRDQDRRILKRNIYNYGRDN